VGIVPLVGEGIISNRCINIQFIMERLSVGILTPELTYIKTHVLSLVLASSLIFASVYGFNSLIEKHDARKAQEYSLVAKQIQDSNTAFQQSVTVQLASLAKQNADLEKQNEALVAALATRQVVEKKVPVTVASQDAKTVATQLGGTAIDDSNISLPLPAARTALIDIQLVPLLTQDKSDLEKSNGLLQTQIANVNTALSDETKLYTNEVAGHKADNEANAAEIKLLKKKNLLAKLKWFGIGYLVGKLTPPYV
jgi:hypothetical protein